MKKLLYQLDTDEQPSVFDSVVAFDGGADQVIGHAGIRPATVGALVEGAIYTRGARDKRNTALFVGGSDLALGEAVLAAVQARFFGNFRVSVMLDCAGCNTTAASCVALTGKAVTITDMAALVLAGTGPVGMRVAGLLALAGARVTIAGREAARSAAAANAVAARFGVPVRSAAAADAAARAALVREAAVVVSAGAGGVALLEEAAWRAAPGLRAIADLNPAPPAGVAGVAPGDRARERDGVLLFGALGVGGLKLRLHRACIAQLFESNDRVLDAAEIFAVARGMA